MSFRLRIFRSLIFFEKLYGSATFTFNISRQISMSENARVMDESSVIKKRKISNEHITTGMEDNTVLRFYKLSEFAIQPTRGSPYAAGLDLYSARDVILPPHGKVCVATDIQIAIPEGCYGRVAPRSGLALKHHIDVGAGVIDYDYRGNVGVVMFNFSSTPFEVKVGDRVAQLILERIYMPTVLESKEALPETSRGSGGFGSTGGFQVQNGHDGTSVPSGAQSQNGHDQGALSGAPLQNGHDQGAPSGAPSQDGHDQGAPSGAPSQIGHDQGAPFSDGSGDASKSLVANSKIE